MKKTLAAIAVLGAFAGTSMAADVVLYGRMDTGLAYTNVDQDRGAAYENDTFEMTTGFSTGSRWGLKGSEELGNGMKVGFVLESGYSSDTGALPTGNRIFHRESTVSFGGNFGTFYFGRMNTLASDGGTMTMMGDVSAVGNAYGLLSAKGSTGSTWDRYDNLIGYVSPNFNGLTLAAQYSMGASGESENKAVANRYGVIGAKYVRGPINVAMTAEYTVYAHQHTAPAEAGALSVDHDVDNGVAVMLGGNYDFGAAKVYAKATYFDNMKAILDSFAIGDDKFLTTKVTVGGKTYTAQYEGWGAELGTAVPVLGGTVLAAVGYRNAEVTKDSADEYKRINVGAAYTYPFSKRTNVYASVAYAQEKSEKNDKTAQASQVGVGLVHRF